MLGKILTDTLNTLDNYQSAHPEEVSDMQFQLAALKAHMKWVRRYWEEPTSSQLEEMKH